MSRLRSAPAAQTIRCMAEAAAYAKLVKLFYAGPANVLSQTDAAVRVETNLPASDTRLATARPGDNWRFRQLHVLLFRAEQGDKHATRLFLAELSDWLRSFYRRKLPSVAVDDAVQEAVSSVYRSRQTYGGERPVSAWLCATASYKWIDHLCSMSRAATETLDDEAPGNDSELAIVSAVSPEMLLGTLGGPSQQ